MDTHKHMPGKYWLFGGIECYYASGGLFDLVATSNSLDGLLETAKKPTGEGPYKDSPWLEWWHIIDTGRMVVVAQSDGASPYGACGGEGACKVDGLIA